MGTLFCFFRYYQDKALILLTAHPSSGTLERSVTSLPVLFFIGFPPPPPSARTHTSLYRVSQHATGILGWITLCCGWGWLVHFSKFDSIPNLYPLDAGSNFPYHNKQKYIQTFSNVFLGAKSLLFENNWSVPICIHIHIYCISIYVWLMRAEIIGLAHIFISVLGTVSDTYLT